MNTCLSGPTVCTCGRELPMHLFLVGLRDHVCFCERRWVQGEDGTVSLAGISPNPLARAERGEDPAPDPSPAELTPPCLICGGRPDQRGLSAHEARAARLVPLEATLEDATGSHRALVGYACEICARGAARRYA